MAPSSKRSGFLPIRALVAAFSRSSIEAAALGRIAGETTLLSFEECSA